MGPALFVVAAVVSGTRTAASAAVAGYLLQEYLSAVVAYAVARIVHRFNVRLKHARDIGSYELIEPVADVAGEQLVGALARQHHRDPMRTRGLGQRQAGRVVALAQRTFGVIHRRRQTSRHRLRINRNRMMRTAQRLRHFVLKFSGTPPAAPSSAGEAFTGAARLRAVEALSLDGVSLLEGGA